MYQVLFSNGHFYAAATAKEAYKYAVHGRREAMAFDEGLPGVVILRDNGDELEDVCTMLKGDHITLKEADVSIRLYNAVYRQAIRVGAWNPNFSPITIGEIKDMILREELGHTTKGVGTKILIELLEVLGRYLGTQDETHFILMNEIVDSPLGKTWFKNGGQL